MEQERSRWLVLEEDGWRIVIPEFDVRPHSTATKGKKRELAYTECPCGPKVSWEDQSVIHNSFSDKMGLEISVKRNLEEI